MKTVGEALQLGLRSRFDELQLVADHIVWKNNPIPTTCAKPAAKVRTRSQGALLARWISSPMTRAAVPQATNQYAMPAVRGE